jgi:hypothetical protein
MCWSDDIECFLCDKARPVSGICAEAEVGPLLLQTPFLFSVRLLEERETKEGGVLSLGDFCPFLSLSFSFPLSPCLDTSDHNP